MILFIFPSVLHLYSSLIMLIQTQISGGGLEMQEGVVEFLASHQAETVVEHDSIQPIFEEYVAFQGI